MAINYIGGKIVVFCCIDSASTLSPYPLGFSFDVSNDIYSERLDAVFLYLADNRLLGRMIRVPAEEIFVQFEVVTDDLGRLRRIRIGEDIKVENKYLVAKYPAVWNTAEEALPFLVQHLPEALVFEAFIDVVFPFHYSEIQTEKERNIWWLSVGFTREEFQTNPDLQNRVLTLWKQVKNLP